MRILASKTSPKHMRVLGIALAICFLSRAPAVGAWPSMDETRLTVKWAADSNQMGTAVASDGSVIVVGAPREDEVGTDSGAVYVYTNERDEYALQAKLRPDDAAPHMRFGTSVAIEGDRIVVGAPGRNDADGEGAAYVFIRRGLGWVQELKLDAMNGAATDGRFGYSVAVDGSIVAVGAPYDDEQGSNAGAVYLIEILGPHTIRQEKITIDSAAPSDFFGWSLALSPDFLVVGAPFKNDDGAVFAYKRKTKLPSWSDVKTITPSPEAHERFGFAVSVSDDRIVVGAPYADDAGEKSGAAYVYSYHSLGILQYEWVLEVRLTGHAEKQYYGHAVAIRGTRLVVGAPRYSTDLQQFGIYYIYRRLRMSWIEDGDTLFCANQPVDKVGFSVALTDSDVVAGAPGKDAGAINDGAATLIRKSDGTWRSHLWFDGNEDPYRHLNRNVAMDGDTAVAGGNDRHGSVVFVFRRYGNGWLYTMTLWSIDTPGGGTFGTSVAMDGDTLVVADQYYNITGATYEGAAYVFSQIDSSWDFARKLTSPQAQEKNYFGSSIAIHEDTIVVGESNAPDGGAAWVFSGADWAVSEPLLTGPYFLDPEGRYGSSVAVNGNRIAVGDPYDGETAPFTGAVYVFYHYADGWDCVRKILDEWVDPYQTKFGTSLAMSESFLAVGTPYAKNNKGESTGAVFMYEHQGVDFTIHSGLFASSGNDTDQFGFAVSIYDDLLVVGAPGVDGAYPNTGAAYLFQYHQCTENGWYCWVDKVPMTISDGLEDDGLGYGVAVGEDVVLLARYSRSDPAAFNW
jgi:hypothetical protein